MGHDNIQHECCGYRFSSRAWRPSARRSRRNRLGAGADSSVELSPAAMFLSLGGLSRGCSGGACRQPRSRHTYPALRFSTLAALNSVQVAQLEVVPTEN